MYYSSRVTAQARVISKGVIFISLTVEQIKTLALPVFENHGVSDIVLFGSYAKGNATYSSDVDLSRVRASNARYSLEVNQGYAV